MIQISNQKGNKNKPKYEQKVITILNKNKINNKINFILQKNY